MLKWDIIQVFISQQAENNNQISLRKLGDIFFMPKIMYFLPGLSVGERGEQAWIPAGEFDAPRIYARLEDKMNQIHPRNLI